MADDGKIMCCNGTVVISVKDQSGQAFGVEIVFSDRDTLGDVRGRTNHALQVAQFQFDPKKPE